MDREKVIKGLEVCFDSSKECNGCTYITTPYCKTTLRNDVIALLKEQEAVIRCKDCKYAHKTYDGDCKYCDMFTDDDGNPIERYRPSDWFCADGERK